MTETGVAIGFDLECVGGLWGSSCALLAGRVACERRVALLAVLPTDEAAERFAEDVAALTGVAAEALLSLPDVEHVDAASAGLRMDQAGRLDEPGPRVWAASLSAASERWPDREEYERCMLRLRRGTEVGFAALLRRFAEAGYERLPFVEEPGHFAVRGGLVDVWPLGAAQPVRIELLDDAIGSLRQFDPDTQESRAELDSVSVPLVDAQEVARRAHGRCGPRLVDRLDAQMVFVDVSPPPADLARRGAWMWSRMPLPGGAQPKVESLQRFSGRLADRARELAALARRCRRLFLYVLSDGEQSRLRRLLDEGGAGGAQVVFRRGWLHEGFVWDGEAHVSAAAIFGRRPLTRTAALRARAEWDAFREIEAGDFVVHEDYGIGRFHGFAALEREGGMQEFAKIEYADHTFVYVPATDLDRLQKYIGGTDEAPALSRIGTSGWSEAKARARESARQLAQDLLRIQALRRAVSGIAYLPDGDWQAEFEAAFPYEETPDQEAAAEAIRADMQSARPMDRLLCGEVGYGKTEIAMRAAFRAVAAGKQVAVLVPTTVLAEQHGRTFRERMAEFPVTVEVLSRFRSAAEQRDILARAAAGAVDILIGTHRILQPDVRFADLGLVIIDEEQRFGVEHKERLKRLRAEVDVLTMTATPIPRTLHMALLGLRDISSLATPPVDRRAVRTEVRVYDEERVREAIEFEIARGGQVYYVCPRIETAEAALDRLRALVPGAAIALAHGQMDAERLERTMLAFLEREIEVLVATTIVESGLDIPAANTLIVEDADRFGLADLHQLRGRVGRWKRQAYALFLVPRDRPVTPNAWRRLKAIEEFSELGAGFRIALRDLEIRGAGNLLGKEQSGHIAAVGYEMYCALLEQAVREVQGQGISPQWPEPKIEVPGAFGVPANYVPDAPARMEVYRLIARARTEEAVEEARRRIEDRFGRIPAEVAELLRRARWRCRARARGVLSLSVAGGIVQVRLAAGGNPEWLKRSGARCFEDGTWWLPAGHDPASTVERLLSA